MSRAAALAFGLFAYLLFMAVFAYAVGFVGNLVVPRTIDSGPVEPLAVALAIDVGFLALFGVPHSVMARPAFKRWWTRFVPQPLERSVYVFVASVTLALIMWQWRAIPTALWSFDSPALRWALYGVSFAGWGLVFVSTLYTGHFDLTGVRQVYLHWQGREYAPVPFNEGGLYGRLRHPLILGFIIALWATPHMTVGHLVFAGGMTVYGLIGIRLEERDLVGFLGEPYVRYRERVPMLIPRLRG